MKVVSIVKLSKQMQLSKSGFTIIEFLIVLSILAIAGTLVTTSYLSFEKRKRVENAALEVKNQIRFAQNNALSGNKEVSGTLSEFCPNDSELVGWYVLIKVNSSQLEIIGDCIVSGSENKFAKKTVSLARDVKVVEIVYQKDITSDSKDEAYVLFRPLEPDAKFFDENIPFLSVSGNYNLTKLMGGSVDQGSVTVTLEGESQTRYEVEILPTGEVNERKI